MVEFKLEKDEFIMAVNPLEDCAEKLQRYDALQKVDRYIANRYVEFMNAKGDFEKSKIFDEISNALSSFCRILETIEWYCDAQRAKDFVSFLLLTVRDTKRAIGKRTPTGEEVKLFYYQINLSVLLVRACTGEHLKYYDDLRKKAYKAANMARR